MPSQSKSVHFISLGCSRNLVDSEMMLGALQENNYTLSDQAAQAELIVVNTCGFIDSAKQESVDTILEAAQFKYEDKGICKHLIVTGCLSERYPGELKKNIPEIDVIMGSTGFSQIIEAVEALDTDNNFSYTKNFKKDYDIPRVNSQPFYTAYLKLAEGCAKRCSFCVIPKIRGPLRSRSHNSLIREALSLCQNGAVELNLIAQDLTDYGRDRKEDNALENLLKDLVKIKSLKWIRLFYTYPDQLNDEIISLIKNEDKICTYLDVPVQHISDSVLKGMNRKTTGTDIENMIIKLKKEIPDIVLRTSLMVGFPNESDEDFTLLKSFVEKGYFEHIGIFTYSHEEESLSYKNFEDLVPQEIKEKRREELYGVQQEVLQTKLKKYLGQEIDVLIEGAHDETPLLLKSRHFGQGPGVDNYTLINEGQAQVGEIVRVKINDLVGIDLLAAIV